GDLRGRRPAGRRPAVDRPRAPDRRGRHRRGDHPGGFPRASRTTAGGEAVRKLLCGVVLLGGLGCMHVQPVGPLAKVTGTPKGGPAVGPTLKNATWAESAVASDPRPPRPAEMITPGEVTAETAPAAAQRLASELEIDGKATPNVPLRSVYKGGVKVE